jgi:phosphoglycolate phosphatase
MNFEVVIFDLDGTLLNTLEDIADAANGVLAKYGLPTHDKNAFRYFIGDGVDILFRRALPRGDHADGFVSQCVREFRESYEKTWNNKTKPYPQIPELLDELKNRGVKMAVLSNKPHDFTVKCVSELLSGWNFFAVLGAREGYPLKPDPAGAREIVESAGAAPARVTYVGDTAVDMKTAARAGLCAVGALWGFRTREELEDNGAKIVIGHPLDLLKYLEM